MANIQNLSPQGYNIQDAPLNQNPFWEAGSIDPSIYTRLEQCEEDIDALEQDKAEKTQLNNYYTKTEINTKESALGNRIAGCETSIGAQGGRLTTAEGDIDTLEGKVSTLEGKVSTLETTTIPGINTALEGKADSTDLDTLEQNIEDISQTQTTQGGAITALQQTVGGYSSTISALQQAQDAQADTITALQSTVGGKADASDVYTKQEVDLLIPDTSDFITDTQLQTVLEDYYTKSEIDDILGDINSVLEVVLNGND